MWLKMKIKNTAKLMDIKLLDYLILSIDRYFMNFKTKTLVYVSPNAFIVMLKIFAKFIIILTV